MFRSPCFLRQSQRQGRRLLISGVGYFCVWISLTTAYAEVTLIPQCSLHRVTEQTLGFPSLSATGKRLALGTISSEPSTESVTERYTERYLLIETKKKTQTEIFSRAYEGRGRTPFIRISPNGNFIVLATAGNPTGENTDGNSEIFLFNVKKKRFSQITNTKELDYFLPAIGDNGKRIAFLSNEYLVKDGTEDMRMTLSSFDVSTQQTTQIAQTNGFSSLIWDFSLSNDGTKLVFASNLDPTGNNTDGTFEIFLWNVTAQTFTQITNTTRSETSSGNSSSPIINADGTVVVFNSVANLTGENTDGNFELFLFDVRTGILAQLTHTEGSSGLYGDAAISADGKTVVFEGNKDLLTGNIDNISDGNDSEIFLLNTPTRTITQLTHSDGMSFLPTISADGKSIVFNSARRYFVSLGALRSFTPPPDPDAGVYLATCP